MFFAMETGFCLFFCSGTFLIVLCACFCFYFFSVCVSPRKKFQARAIDDCRRRTHKYKQTYKISSASMLPPFCSKRIFNLHTYCYTLPYLFHRRHFHLTFFILTSLLIGRAGGQTYSILFSYRKFVINSHGTEMPNY